MPSRRLKMRRALGAPLVADEDERLVVGRAGREGAVGLVDRHPLDLVRDTRRLPPVERQVRAALHLEHLQPAAVAQLAHLHRVLRRDVAVEARREGEVVLGHVEDAALAVDVDRLVGEAPGGADRPRLLVLAGPPGDRDLEHVAVPLRQQPVVTAGEVGADVGSVDGLLAGQPRAPRRRAAGAVHLRAVAAHPGPHLVGGPRDLERHRAAPRHRVIRLGRRRRTLGRDR